MSLLAAAGELATDFGITDWPSGAAIWGVQKCFDAWIQERGGKNSGHDDREALRCVKQYIEQHPNDFEIAGGGRAPVLSTSNNGAAPIVRDRAGFRRTTIKRGIEYLFLTETFRTRVVPKFNEKSVLKALQTHGLLRRKDSHWGVQFRKNGERMWVYCVSGRILEWDAERGEQ
jgi:putative DNA primase/helicase